MNAPRHDNEPSDNIKALRAIVKKIDGEDSVVIDSESKSAILDLKNLIHDEAIRLANAKSEEKKLMLYDKLHQQITQLLTQIKIV